MKRLLAHIVFYLITALIGGVIAYGTLQIWQSVGWRSLAIPSIMAIVPIYLWAVLEVFGKDKR